MPKKVLIIDDDKVTLDFLCERIKEEGYVSIPAGTGEDGVGQAQSTVPDFAIIDTVLPGMDGFETCRQIKEAHEAVQIIVTTSKVDAINVAKARGAGASGYCVKTSNCDELVKALKDLDKNDDKDS